MFFEPLPAEPAAVRPADYTAPVWQEPPLGRFCGVIPMQEVIARSANARVVLIELRAFSEGCLLDVNAVARRGDLTDEEWMGGRGLQLVFHHPQPGEPLPPELLRFGVQFADGRRTTTVRRMPGYGEQQDLEPPVLHTAGGRASTDPDGALDVMHPLWLWPAPPAEPFDLVVEWPAVGIELTRYQLDGRRIAEAAQQSRSYWDAN
jgi:hypothetical protein